MDLREAISGVMAWIDLAEDRDRWRALVSAVMKSRRTRCAAHLHV
jgi:hypothetical protein